MVFVARRACYLGPANPVPRIPLSPEALLTKNDFPQFDMDEVALLITAVRKALERLKRANEARAGSDPEFLEYAGATVSSCRSWNQSPGINNA